MQCVFAGLLNGATAAVALSSVANRSELCVPKSSFERSTPYFHQLTSPLKMTLALSRDASSVWYKMCEQLLWSCTRAQEVWESERRPEVR